MRTVFQSCDNFRALVSRVKRRVEEFTRLKPQIFDLGGLDPPRLAKSPFGVDTVNDYQSLFKPALLSTKRGGELLVTNNVAKVDADGWIEMLDAVR